MDDFAKFPFASVGAMFTGLGYLISQVATYKKNAQPIAGVTEDRVKVLLQEHRKEILADVRQILNDKGV